MRVSVVRRADSLRLAALTVSEPSWLALTVSPPESVADSPLPSAISCKLSKME